MIHKRPVTVHPILVIVSFYSYESWIVSWARIGDAFRFKVHLTDIKKIKKVTKK